MKRKGTKEERWASGQVENMKGTPWEPEPGREEAEVAVRPRIWSDKEKVDGPRIPEEVDRPKIRRRFRCARCQKYISIHTNISIFFVVSEYELT